MNSLAEMKKLKAQMVETMKAKGQEMLQVEFNKFFADNPGISALGWTQYTPYFNDGDSCEFGIGDMYACTLDPAKATPKSFSGWGEDKGWIGTFLYGGHDKTPENERLAKNIKAFSKLVEDNELFRMTFGDHVKVIAKPGKFEITEYNHD